MEETLKLLQSLPTSKTERDGEKSPSFSFHLTLISLGLPIGRNNQKPVVKGAQEAWSRRAVNGFEINRKIKWPR